MSKGKLIVIEGLDGSGKATQADLLYKKIKLLNNTEKEVHKISFPDYEQPSSSLVKMYLNSEFGDSIDSVNVYAVSTFFAIDRYVSYKKFWESYYKNGDIIIADRYTTSNAIYQLSRLEKKDWNYYINWLKDFEYNKLNLPKPDLVIYLDVPVEISQKFIKNRYNGDDSKKDIYEKNINYLKLCRQVGKYVANRLNWKIVSCVNENNLLLKIEEISCLIYNIIKDNIC